MKQIEINNEELTKLLTNTLDIFYGDNVKNLLKEWYHKERTDNLITQYGPCSDEYLHEAFKHDLKYFSHPRAMLGAQLLEMEDTSLRELFILEKRIRSIGRFLGPSMNGIAVAYPDKGYIGWHHNGNYPGHNILFSYSLDGDGSFNYWDYETKSIQKMQDKPGWNTKVGYYPSEDTEPDNVYWHMAETKHQRVSIAFILENEAVWKDMIERITQKTCDELGIN